MEYLKTDGAGGVLKYPYRLSDLKSENPAVSFPRDIPENTLADYNVFPVTVEAKPAFDGYTQYLTKNPPQDIGGVWTVTWTVNDYTQQEIDDRVAGEVSGLTDRTTIDTALAMLVADIWRSLNTGVVPNQNPTMTEQEARDAVKQRLESHLRTLKGL